MLNIIPIPALTGTYDNYIWIIHDDHKAIAVDPGDAAPVLQYLKEHELELCALLITHRHNDHCAGIEKLAEVYNIKVFGPRSDMIPLITHHVFEGDRVNINELGLSFDVLNVPGHLPEHLAYVGQGWLFCGDVMFGCGCGKMFIGSPQEFHHSLQRFANLSEDTLVYCAHEYTESNIRFALLCDPNNPQLINRQLETMRLLDQGSPTLPSTIALEKATNPFLRCSSEEIVRHVTSHFNLASPPKDEVEVFALLRTWRDHF